MKKMIAATIIILLAMPGFTAAYTYNSKEFTSIVKKLDMQGHADHELSTCSVKKVYYEEIIEMLNGGKSEEQVLQSYVNEYGQAALRTPGKDKSGLIAWGMPAAGFAGGAAIVALWIRKLKTKATAGSGIKTLEWESETEKQITEKVLDEERRKLF
ncbi:cytochrome c-type biogenesis protein CcmH [Mesobacillus zeae]|uniref:Cytochrome c-type biogenesis protein n=1 Tax=Mesobacillus zeae TaxID=1917180 RepID=A0A398AZN1_9BACI|nr:cytochrome c-type biogenesis protein CcmH [Mesobacillus zeae]RID83057.1 hypothetical protein D1970_16170 [Mesobacillus zeae]